MTKQTLFFFQICPQNLYIHFLFVPCVLCVIFVLNLTHVTSVCEEIQLRHTSIRSCLPLPYIITLACHTGYKVLNEKKKTENSGSGCGLLQDTILVFIWTVVKRTTYLHFRLGILNQVTVWCLDTEANLGQIPSPLSSQNTLSTCPVFRKTRFYYKYPCTCFTVIL